MDFLVSLNQTKALVRENEVDLNLRQNEETLHQGGNSRNRLFTSDNIDNKLVKLFSHEETIMI